LIDKLNAITFLRRVQSVFLRKNRNWQCYQCKKTSVVFYYNPQQEKLTFVAPKELSWLNIFVGSKFKNKLGYASEWEVHQDVDGNEFYHNVFTKECFWDKPIDAVDPSPAEKLCTAFKVFFSIFLFLFIFSILI
jgi:hypothetical protein